MFTDPEAMRTLSAEISDGLRADAERHRLLKAARRARRGRHARRFRDRLRHR
jgi:hypothetical protein